MLERGQEFLGFPTPLPASWQPNRNGTGHWLRVSEAGTSKDRAGPGWPRGVLRAAPHPRTWHPGDEFPSILFWGRNQLKIVILRLGRREIDGRGWTWPWTPWAASLIWVLDAPWLCVGSWCKVRCAERTRPLGNSPVQDLRQTPNLFPSVFSAFRAHCYK